MKVDKGYCAEIWERLGCNKSAALAARITAAAEAQTKPGYQLDLGALRNIDRRPPNASTWLNRGRYDDDPYRVESMRNGGAQNFEAARYGDSE